MIAREAIQFSIVPRAGLTDRQKSGMFALLSGHFEGVAPGQFARDLAEKHLALLLEQAGRLVGFSTLMAYPARFEEEPINVIYSGDTIVTPGAWGSTALPRAWVAGVTALQESLPPGRCFWMLLTSGFRTYRFLPLFWREFFPRHDADTPPDIARLMSQLARDRFQSRYDSRTGIVRFDQPQRLCPSLGIIPTGREQDPHVAYFLSRNPGHGDGDELVCLAEICPENLSAAGRRMTRASIREPVDLHR